MHIWEKGRAAGQVRLFVGNRGSGGVNVSPGRVQEKWPVDNSGSASAISWTGDIQTRRIYRQPYYFISSIVDIEWSVSVCLKLAAV